MSTKTLDRASARERLLAAANELFYEEGVHTVGIDRVIERAGVAKATLYNAFGSKDELVRAYLEGRHERTRTRMTRELAARFSTARERLIGVFEIQADTFTMPGFRGCAFVGASAEARSGSPIEAASVDYRTWVRTLFLDLAREAGAADPERLALKLHLLYDGASIAAWLDHDASAGEDARAVATMLVDAAVPPPRKARKR